MCVVNSMSDSDYKCFEFIFPFALMKIERFSKNQELIKNIYIALSQDFFKRRHMHGKKYTYCMYITL